MTTIKDSLMAHLAPAHGALEVQPKQRTVSQQYYSKVSDMPIWDKDLSKFEVFQVDKKMTGSMIMQRYEIEGYIDKGCYG